MGKVTGFIEFKRDKQPYRPVGERLRDWRQVMRPWPTEQLQKQGARCMDCGIPFCHQGCPLGNLIPDWNDLVYRDKWHEAIERLHATNNFPEFTGTLCPAPCEGSCVLGINDDAVTIKAIELAIIDHAWEAGWIAPARPAMETGKKVAVIGSGPAGLAAAQQLRRAGHLVTVFERDDRIGGLLRYGIPEFKMEKRVLERRLRQMDAEGVVFRAGCHVGIDVGADDLRSEFDAVLLCGGATRRAICRFPGGSFPASTTPWSTSRCRTGGARATRFPTNGSSRRAAKRVVIIGGGDTGADCLGTVHRQGARSVHQFEILPRPPDQRAADNPWPQWPNVYRVSSAHEEGGERVYSVSTRRFLGDERGHLRALEVCQVETVKDASGRITFRDVPGSEFVLPCELALLAMGFVGPERPGMLEQLGVTLTERGNVSRDANWMTSVPGVFTAGDMQRGQSLIVWAIAEGRSAARGVDVYLMGRSDLPAPLL